MTLGFISERYESSGRGPGTISKPGKDPGGKSYGIYQLSRKTLWDYVQQSEFQFNNTLFTSEFDEEWIRITERYTIEFALDQRLFITKRLYLPCIIFARSLGYDTWSRKIQESVFSLAVQHGGADQIVKSAYAQGTSVDTQVGLLYAQRWAYVKNLGLSDQLKASLQNRYKHELTDVLNLWESTFAVGSQVAP